ncbi:hypothetical protein Nepgr_003669 [Nepenthes gracilis]|uniref:Uncharacterized protein n=1 Tax=Nepenthes gracilis TaxID=150966 RepID=A0AAD3XE58_NEPGR|nr:hypothetical protein Nepgr_003669 [Nepenthes gracilis]
MSSSSSSPAAATATATHILVFPYPAQGHMLALLDLTQQLALKGLTITILVTPKNLQLLDPILSSQPSIRTLILPFPNHPKLPVGVENVKDIGNHGNSLIIAALAKLRGPLIQWFKSHPSPPQAILSDFFLGWTNNLADELNIPRIAFFSTASFLACVFSYLWLHIDTVRHLPVVEFPDLPGLPSFIQAHTPSIFRQYRDSDSDWEVTRDGMIANLSSWGIVFNSFSALEGDYLEHMKKKSVHGRVYGVGPLTLMAGSERLNRVNPDSETKYSVLKWLDNQPEGSVLYVCFGSQKLLTTAQMEALASGLEHSMTRFIWVVRSGFSGKVEGEEGHGTVPGGFEERVGCRGLVIKWAPQVEILSHRAVGGFLSHCGWNSVLESVAAGVMILAWPTEADQFVNARLLVDDLGVAVRVCEGGDAAPDSVELARIISESLSGNVPQKERAKALREKTLEAAKAGGSSSTAMDELVEELRHL